MTALLNLFIVCCSQRKIKQRHYTANIAKLLLTIYYKLKSSVQTFDAILS